jgi:hypothetical protein
MALELGPCKVEFNGTDLGKTLGGVVVRFKDDYVDLKSDQFGTAPEDTVITGSSAELDVPLAELDFAKIATILNQELIGASSGVIGENNVGTSLKAAGAELVLTKYSAGVPSTKPEDKITFPLAAPLADAELNYDSENQRVMKTMFKCYYSAVTANWGTAAPVEKTVLYFFGDKTAEE